MNQLEFGAATTFGAASKNRFGALGVFFELGRNHPSASWQSRERPPLFA
jgi:hypothetical protein